MKIVIQGESFEFDGTKKPMLEALELEKQLGWNYGKYESELQAGSMKAIAGFIWQVWFRNGRRVELADVLSGEIEIDVAEVMESLAEAAAELQAEQDDADPTVPATLPTTATSTSRSSRSTSTSGRGR